MKCLPIIATLVISVLSVSSQALGTETRASCYSAYHLQQQLNMSVNYGASIQHQKSKTDVELHVRELPVSNNSLSLFKGKAGSARNIRSYIVLVNANSSKLDGVDIDMSERYSHPFMVFVDGDNGELIDLQSTVKDPSVINEYLSFFDFFQYSERSGEYYYRNGNGRYRAQMINTENKPAQITKKNNGYLKTGDKNSKVIQVQESVLSIDLNKSLSECFYQKAYGEESFKTTLSADASVDGNARITIDSDPKLALPPAHFFYSLTDDRATWPGFNKIKTITRKEAFQKLPSLVDRLSSLVNDDVQFLKAMIDDKDVWPYMAEYILENGLSNDLSIQLFWSLNKIDSTESVSALTKLVTSPLSDRDHLRAALALGNTSASFDQDGIDMLKNHMLNFTDPEFVKPVNLTYIRMVGAMAFSRNNSDPRQSSELKSFLYSQVGGFDESVNAAVIDAIGNLKGSIDSEGEDILWQGLAADSVKLRVSAASALKRVPYKEEYSDAFINQLSNENNVEIRSTIVEALGQADNADMKVKSQLLSLVSSSNSQKLKNKSLGSLKKIDYDFQSDDIDLLESMLRRETDKANQRQLATLILKHRRKTIR